MKLGGNDTAWGNFDNDDGGQGTLSYTWNGHPACFLTTEVLGVNIGFHKEFDKNKIIISPQSENLSWAKGVVPHPPELVAFEWGLEREHLSLDCSSSKGRKFWFSPGTTG